MMRFLPYLASLVGCAGASWRTPPHDLRFQQAPPPILHARPADRPGSSHADAFRAAVPYAVGRSLRASRLLGSPAPLDVNDFGEVIDSTWFENRIGRRSMSAAELARGPNRIDGPADGPLIVLSAKTSGGTIGFVVKDQAGEKFVLKFDVPTYPGLASGAEIISTKLLHAAGYHVPENYLLNLDVDRLVLIDGAKTLGRYRDEIPLDRETFERMLSSAAPFPDRRARAIFSRFIEGKIIGPFPFEGTTADDPNDEVAHERRRSLRGMWVFAAWLDNIDMRPTNTLDTFLPVKEGLGYVKHYWLDFGTALGSYGGLPKPPEAGHEYSLDWKRILARVLTLGIHRDPWELEQTFVKYRCVGTFDAERFDPDDWVARNPVAPFDQASRLDTFWAASILARFTEDHLRAAVATARYPEEGAAEYVVKVLRARQLALLRHAFARVLPLADPMMVADRLEMRDLTAEAGLAASARYRHQVRIDRARGKDEVLISGAADRPEIDLRAAIDAAARSGAAFLTATFARDDSSGTVEVHLRRIGDRAVPVAITRPSE